MQGTRHSVLLRRFDLPNTIDFSSFDSSAWKRSLLDAHSSSQSGVVFRLYWSMFTVGLKLAVRCDHAPRKSSASVRHVYGHQFGPGDESCERVRARNP